MPIFLLAFMSYLIGSMGHLYTVFKPTWTFFFNYGPGSIHFQSMVVNKLFIRPAISWWKRWQPEGRTVTSSFPSMQVHSGGWGVMKPDSNKQLHICVWPHFLWAYTLYSCWFLTYLGDVQPTFFGGWKNPVTKYQQDIPVKVDEWAPIATRWATTSYPLEV